MAEGVSLQHQNFDVTDKNLSYHFLKYPPTNTVSNCYLVRSSLPFSTQVKGTLFISTSSTLPAGPRHMGGEGDQPLDPPLRKVCFSFSLQWTVFRRWWNESVSVEQTMGSPEQSFQIQVYGRDSHCCVWVALEVNLTLHWGTLSFTSYVPTVFFFCHHSQNK